MTFHDEKSALVKKTLNFFVKIGPKTPRGGPAVNQTYGKNAKKTFKFHKTDYPALEDPWGHTYNVSK